MQDLIWYHIKALKDICFPKKKGKLNEPHDLHSWIDFTWIEIVLLKMVNQWECV